MNQHCRPQSALKIKNQFCYILGLALLLIFVGFGLVHKNAPYDTLAQSLVTIYT